METATTLRDTLIKRILRLPKSKLIEIDELTKESKTEVIEYNPEFVKKILLAFEEEGRELTPEYEKELFGDEI